MKHVTIAMMPRQPHHVKVELCVDGHEVPYVTSEQLLTGLNDGTYEIEGDWIVNPKAQKGYDGYKIASIIFRYEPDKFVLFTEDIEAARMNERIHQNLIKSFECTTCQKTLTANECSDRWRDGDKTVAICYECNSPVEKV